MLSAGTQKINAVSLLAQPRAVSAPVFATCKTRLLEACQPGREARPTAAVCAIHPSVVEDGKLETLLEEQIRAQVRQEQMMKRDTDSLNNLTGLNGLATNGTMGLQSGVFQVASVLPVNYVIQEMEDIFNPENKALLRNVVPGSFPNQLTEEPQPGMGQRRFVVIDENIHALHGARIEEYFAVNGVEIQMLPLPTREANKDFELVYEIARQLEDFGINRRKEPIIAIGGGVCLDVVGLAANLYRRNTPVIKIPTTVMAAIDASIGIKTAVNFNQRKNKMGTYCPPLAVFIDRTFLQTLDQRNLSNGAAEMLKMACVKDDELFHMLEDHGAAFIAQHFQGGTAGKAIRRSIQGMLEELENNLYEHILTRLVDYGHTFSPELEMEALNGGDELLHGEAVNIDMALTTQLSYARGMISLEQRNRVFKVMHSLQLPFWHQACSSELFYKGLKDTVKARDGMQRVPLMNDIGSAQFINDITFDELREASCVLQTVAKANSHALIGDVTSSIVPFAAALEAEVTEPCLV